MKIQAIIPTAGIGARLKTGLPKPLVELCGKPLCAHTLEAFERSPVIDSIVLVGHADQLFELGNIVKQYQLKKVTKIVAGGETRCESVSKGLAVLDADADIVVVHDGARPLVSLETISDAVALCREAEAVVVAVPVKSTIKRVNQKDLSVEETLDREGLWEIQTPQVFKKDILIKAHAQKQEGVPTDDAMMVEQLGVRVKVFSGDYRNIKITTQEDLTVAEAFCRLRKT
ncbi:MAG: 2-C-methyl-D-erythritol 4-phosphate cytidylyltransferase [Candidatus Omnitrophica bacterium]|nr:2-C-methyl-D-erythritol 4-phosphate cytidylyltransferase [Candidatus Omnitrophota bacterium]